MQKICNNENKYYICINLKYKKIMKIYKTQQEVKNDIKNGVLKINEDVKFECLININANIIIAGNISAGNISAGNISARDISAGNISAVNISAWNISAGDISAVNISAWNISARDISYYAFCISYKSIKCKSWKGRRDNHKEPICIDGKLEIISEVSEEEIKKAVETLEKSGKLKDGKILI